MALSLVYPHSVLYSTFSSFSSFAVPVLSSSFATCSKSKYGMVTEELMLEEGKRLVKENNVEVHDFIEGRKIINDYIFLLSKYEINKNKAKDSDMKQIENTAKCVGLQIPRND